MLHQTIEESKVIFRYCNLQDRKRTRILHELIEFSAIMESVEFADSKPKQDPVHIIPQKHIFSKVIR